MLKILLLMMMVTVSSSAIEDKPFEYHLLGDFNAYHSTGDHSWVQVMDYKVVGKLFVDGCMYITVSTHTSTNLTHAGNCPNQIHAHQ